MKLGRSPCRLPLALLLLLLSSSAAFALDLAPSPDRLSSALERRDEPLPAYDAKRPEKGTKDAPVDGLDGKPHAGPFVNPRLPPPDTHSGQTNRDHLGAGDAAKPVPEDGVMNDPHRTPPKKGTTGTEGGLSERERDRKAQESETGARVPKTPDPPKDNSFANTIGGKKLEGSSGSAKAPAAASHEKATTAGDDANKNRKAPLEEFGHDTRPPQKGGAPVHDVGSPDDYDRRGDHDPTDWNHDDDDDDDDEEGIHDIIPWDSLAGSFSSIAATEIGDKTFIVAALMAMRHSRLQVFSAAFSALFIMTILSGVAGHAVGAIVSKRWSALVAALLFLGFGAKSLREGLAMSPDQGVNEEIREVQAELEEKEEDMARQASGRRRASSISPYALESGRAANGRRSRSRSRLAVPRSPSSSRSRSRSRPRATLKSTLTGVKNLLSLLLSPAWVETFSMTFVGELGDRSQIATVAMAAGQEYFWVMVGASLGHFVCTAVAVLGGSVLAGRVSLRKVTLVGGSIFIGFGFFTLLEAAQYWR